MFNNIFNQIRTKYISFQRGRFNKKNILSLQNKDFSLIASNCNGVFLLHDLSLEFRTPTINLWFEPSDFNKFLSNLDEYISLPIEFSDELEKKLNYPVGILDNTIKIYFQHYKTRQEAEEKWIERCARINKNNIFVMATDRDGCTYQDLIAFDQLPYAHKVIFTHKPYPEIKSAFYIKGFESLDSVGACFSYTSKWSYKKYYDQFPYIEWFNNKL